MKAAQWVSTLVGDWRRRAAQRVSLWERDPAVPIILALADEVEAAANADGATSLTIAQAAAESGYSEAHLRDLAHDGVLRLLDEPGPMRVRRADLPRKPRVAIADSDLSAAGRSLADRVIEDRRT